MSAEQKVPIGLSSFNTQNQPRNEMSLTTLYRKRWTHWEVKCLDSGLAKRTEPGLVCPASSPPPHLCICLVHPGNPSACLRRPPNQSAKWLKLVNVQSTPPPTTAAAWMKCFQNRSQSVDQTPPDVTEQGLNGCTSLPYVPLQNSTHENHVQLRINCEGRLTHL